MGDSETVKRIATRGLGVVTIDEAFFAPARRQGRALERQAREERKARAVSQAQQENERQAAIRQQVRQERIRRAQVISAAEAAGVRGSSVEASTIGSGQTLTAMGQAFASGATLSSNLQSSFLQKAADYNTEGQMAQARGQQWKGAVDLGMLAFKARAREI